MSRDLNQAVAEVVEFNESALLDYELDVDVDGLERIRNIRSLFEPTPWLSMSQWAEKVRVLPKQSSFDAGSWKNRPYQLIIQDEVGKSSFSEGVLMTSAQSSKTEILLNIAFYISDLEPSPILIVQPTVEMGRAFSKDRLSPSINASPRLKEIFGEETNSKKSTSTRMRKEGYNGAVISFASMNSLASLASRSIRILLCDELDRCVQADTNEGNVFDIMAERTSSFPNRKILWVSTPKKIENSNIYKKYINSTQGVLQVRCLHCSDYFDLIWAVVEWRLQKDTAKVMPDSVGIRCPNCGVLHSELERYELIQDVKFRYANPDASVMGWNYNVMATDVHPLIDLVEEFLDAKKDSASLEAFYTLKMGLPFKEDYIEKTAHDYDSRLEDYTVDTLPDEIVHVCMGIDVQKNRFEATTWGISYNDQVFHIAYDVIHADCEIKKEWSVLMGYIKNTTYTTESGIKMAPHSIALDTGYQTRHGYDFARMARAGGLLVYPVKGVHGDNVPVVPIGRRKSKHGKHFSLGVHQMKDIIFRRLQIESSKDIGYIHFSRSGTSDDFFDQLHNEKKTIINRGGRMAFRYEIIRMTVRNEVLDTFVYALSAYYLCKPNLQNLKDRRLDLLATMAEKFKSESKTKKTKDA